MDKRKNKPRIKGSIEAKNMPRNTSTCSGGHSTERKDSCSKNLPPKQPAKRRASQSIQIQQEQPARLPIEMLELIIDSVADGATLFSCSLVCKAWLARCRYYLFSRVSTPAGACAKLLQIIDPAKVKAGSKSKSAGMIMTLPPASTFVQSLVITSSAQTLLAPCPSINPRSNPSLAASLLLESVPNLRELQLSGVTEWALTHILDPLSTTGKLQDLALLDVRCGSWVDASTPLSRCAQNLVSLRISGLRFRQLPSITANGDGQSTEIKEPTTASSLVHEICFPRLKRLAIEQEREDSPFAEQLLDSLAKSPSGIPENLEVLELPLAVASKSKAFFEGVNLSLRTLTIHCDGLRVGQHGTEPELYSLDLGSLFVLNSLHLTIPAHLHYDMLALVALQTLVTALSGISHSTLRTLRLSFRTALGYTPYEKDQWNELDIALSLPHLAGLSRVEFVGLGSIVATVRRGLPNVCARGIIYFIW